MIGLSALTGLEHLNLRLNSLKAEGAAALVANERGVSMLSKLTSLDLGFSEFGERGAHALFANGRGVSSLKELTHLNLSGNLRFGAQSRGCSYCGGERVIEPD